MQLAKPFHNRYLLNGVDNCTYIRYVEVYSGCKRWGVRGIYVFLMGIGLFGVVKEVLKGTLVQYGKRRLAVAVISCASYICAPAVTVLTNATKVVTTCKVVYTTLGYAAETLEDASQISFLPLDIVLFGQPIPANLEGRYSSWSNLTDLIDKLPLIGDQ
jgi:hypothetical protein